MVGLTIGFIAVAIIMQSLSVFEAHKRTTTAGVDAQENGLLALMAIEADIRKAAVGFNHPALLSCQNYYSYYQAVSGTGTPSTVASFSTIPVVITDGAKADSVAIQSGMRIAGAAAPQLATDMPALPTGSPDHIGFEVDRAYDLNGTPEDADDPPADLIVVANPDNGNCSLMRVTSKTGNVLTVKNVPGPQTNTMRRFPI
jgi:Tfp pilus assembly protein PilW